MKNGSGDVKSIKMNNTISMGNFELVLKQASNINGGASSSEGANECPIMPPILIPLLPFLLDYYLKGSDDVKKGASKNSPYPKEKLGQYIGTEVMPSLLKSTCQNEEDDILKEVYSAFPKAKSFVKEIRDKYNPETNDDVQAFAWVPVVIVYTLIAAYAYGSGYKDGKNSKP